jgi:hypothetical protein
MKVNREAPLYRAVRRVAPIVVSALLGPLALAAANLPKAPAGGRFCTSTAEAMFKACGYEAQDDYWKGVAVCTNYSEGQERRECENENSAARSEKSQLCRDQLAARRWSCTQLGEARYDPEFDELLVEHDYAAPAYSNRYYPLRIGYRWEYSGADENTVVEVVDETKLIDEVLCIVVRDIVSKHGFVAEATDDWLALSSSGDVWYCGEEVKDYETFDGDRPRRPELVSIDGSFKAGRDGAKPGILLPGSPVAGAFYLEEFDLGNAEDVAEILSTEYGYGEDDDLDRFVPRALAELLCDENCVVTRNTNRNDPGAEELKYYAPGIGFFLEIDPEQGKALQLVACNVDPRCQQLPRP